MSKSEILQIIQENPKITQTELMKKIGRHNFHSSQLYSLVKEGTVRRTIPTNTRKTWILETIKGE